MDGLEKVKLMDIEIVMNLLRTLKDFTPELKNVDDKELMWLWVKWMASWEKWRLKDYILKNIN